MLPVEDWVNRSRMEDALYLSTLKLVNFRCFRSASLQLRNPTIKGSQQNITLLLGTNGAGKSSLLQAIVFSLLNESLRDSGLRFQNLVRAGENNSQLFAELIKGESQSNYKIAALIKKGESGDIPAAEFPEQRIICSSREPSWISV
jgi:DNA repair exonuclease SbcCD ATPase subunit